MAVRVVNRDPFCSGYIDNFGKWNNGFACPERNGEAMSCCGTPTYHYCCTLAAETGSVSVSESVPVLLGMVFGTLLTVVLCVAALCLFWRAYRTYHKAGSMHRMRPSAGSSGASSTSGHSAALLGRRDGRTGRQDLEDVLQDVDEVAVTRPCRISTVNTIPRTFTSGSWNRDSVTDSVGNSSVSTATDNERQLFLEQCGAPPPYRRDAVLPQGEERRGLTLPRSFSSSAADRADLGVGHYQVPRPSDDDALYRSTKF